MSFLVSGPEVQIIMDLISIFFCML